MSEKYSRLDFVDGLKGIACILIFLHHFTLAFLPGTYYGDSVATKYAWEAWLFSNPISSVINGNFWVCVFCITSGFLLSYTIFIKPYEKVSAMIIKRYFRLALPVFVTSFLVWILMKLGAFVHLEAAQITGSMWLPLYYVQNGTLRDVFETSFVKVWFEGSNLFSTAFWMLKDLFIGSYLSILLSLAGKTVKEKKAPLIWYLLVAMLYVYMDSLQLCFVLGTFLAYVFVSFRDLKIPAWLNVVMFVCAIFLGGYPSEMKPIGVYKHLDFSSSRITDFQLYHIFAAFLLIVVLLYGNLLHKWLESKLCMGLGKISFAVYLLHIPILYSLSCKLFLQYYQSTSRYGIAVLISFIVSLACVMGTSWLFNRFVEGGLNRLINKIMKYF